MHTATTVAVVSPDVSTVKTFTYKLDKFGINRSITYDLEIPPPEFLQETDLLGHLIAKENIPLPFHEDVGKALRKFITVETQKFADAMSDKAVRSALSKEDTFEDISCLSAATFKCAEPSSAENIPFEECFQTVIKKSTPAQLSRIIKEEADMSEKMLALVRARDFEMDRFTRACEAAIDIVSDNDKTIEGRSYDLSVLNDKLRQVNMNYQNQIEALSESQRRMHREMIVNLFTNEDKCHSSGDKILQNPLALNRANQISASIMKKSLSCDSQMTSSHPKVPTSVRDESFTIYIGAQLKTMHNARIVSRDRLSDFCQTPSAGDLNAASEFFDSRRLQLLMSLYRRDLTSVVLLVGRNPQFHIHNRTHFARICEQTAELHFDPLEIQLSQIEAQISKANQERQNQATSPKISGYDAPQGDSFTIDEGLFQPGDIYITYHSNIPSAQVVFHLVSDKSLKRDDISSRHPCIGGLRNIIRLSSKCAVQNITLPLLLVETMAESMTVPWCMSRAELIFKCIKGFLMEVSTGSSNSSATGGGCMAGPNVHYNINFALPSKISPSLFNQITEMFSTIFHLVPSVSA